VEKTTLEQMLF